MKETREVWAIICEVNGKRQFVSHGFDCVVAEYPERTAKRVCKEYRKGKAVKVRITAEVIE